MLNRCCPSSSFHTAPCACRRWHVGSDSTFPGSSGNRGCQECQGLCFIVIPAAKHAVHLLEGKNIAALFDFWKKPDGSGRGQKYSYQPSPSQCLSCCLLRDRSMWLLKIPCKENTFSLQWEGIINPSHNVYSCWWLGGMLPNVAFGEGFPNEAEVPAPRLPCVG